MEEKSIHEDSYLTSIKSYIPGILSILPDQISSIYGSMSVECNVRWTRLIQCLHVNNGKCFFLILGYYKGFSVYEVNEYFDSTLVLQYEHYTISNLDMLQEDLLLVSSTEDTPNFSKNDVHVFSITMKKDIHILRFSSEIQGFLTHPQNPYFCVILNHEIHVFEKDTLGFITKIKTCNSVSCLGSRWIAYSLVDQEVDIQSYDSSRDQSLAYSALNIAANLYSLGDQSRKRVVNYFRGDTHVSSTRKDYSSIVILDLNNGEVLASFQGHQSGVSFMEFDPTGRLLVTVPKDGQYMNVFDLSQIEDNKPKLVYRLFRGVTKAKVLRICFSKDSTWVFVTTKRGTTHIYFLGLCEYDISVNPHHYRSPNSKHKILLKSLFKLRGKSLEEKNLNPNFERNLLSLLDFEIIEVSPSLLLILMSSLNSNNEHVLKVFVLVPSQTGYTEKTSHNLTKLASLHISDVISNNLDVSFRDMIAKSISKFRDNEVKSIHNYLVDNVIIDTYRKADDMGSISIWESPQFHFYQVNSIKDSENVKGFKSHFGKLITKENFQTSESDSVYATCKTEIRDLSSALNTPIDILPENNGLSGHRSSVSEDHDSVNLEYF